MTRNQRRRSQAERERNQLLVALRGITVIAREHPDGSVVVGPQGWEDAMQTLWDLDPRTRQDYAHHTEEVAA